MGKTSQSSRLLAVLAHSVITAVTSARSYPPGLAWKPSSVAWAAQLNRQKQQQRLNQFTVRHMKIIQQQFLFSLICQALICNGTAVTT